MEWILGMCTVLAVVLFGGLAIGRSGASAWAGWAWCLAWPAGFVLLGHWLAGQGECDYVDSYCIGMGAAIVMGFVVGYGGALLSLVLAVAGMLAGYRAFNRRAARRDQ